MRRGMRGGRNIRNDAMPHMREDIQDLDRELELLRRKRQLIEEQQRQFQPTQYQQPQKFNRGHAISPWEQQQPQHRSNHFNQPRTLYNQNEFQFSNLYNRGQSNSGGGFDAGPRNRKRQFNGPRRQDESPGPKRFRDNRPNTGGNFNPPKKFTPKPSQGVGGSQVSAPSPQTPQNKPSPKPFNKKKPFIKTNERPAAGRPNKPLPSTATTDAPNKKVEDKRAFLDYVIKDDDHTQYPKKVQGRIQFATGIIYKNLLGRLDKGSQAHTLYRHIKPILYARIYKAMLNKAVGNVQNIIDLYNAAFPSSTDDELVELAAAKEAERLKSVQPLPVKPESLNLDSRKTKESPKNYFRNNITDIMQNKLTEMINKLKQTYENEYNLQKTAQDGENVGADKTTGDTDTSDAAASADTETVSKSNNDEGTEPADAENAVTDQNKPADEEKAPSEAPENAEGDNTTTDELKNDNDNNTEDAINVKKRNRKDDKHSLKYIKNTENYHVTQVDELVKREMWRQLTRVKDTTLPKLVRNLKTLLDKKKFWIRELSDVYGSDTKQALIEFPSSYEARYAAQCLNRKEFDYAGHKYPLLAEVETSVRHPSPYSERRRSPSNYGESHSYHDRYGTRSTDRDYYLRERDRSRSPVRYHNESSKLDIEIELLRKQRMIIEEERKLLLERKKLELIREYGHNAVQDLAYLDEERDRERRRRPTRAEWRRPPRPRTPPPPRYKRHGNPVRVPLFVLPCKKLLTEMKELTSQAAGTKTYANLLNLLRVTIRKRLAVALEGKPRLSCLAIVKLYRELYPRSTDDELVRKTLATIEQGHFDENEEICEDKESVKEDSVEEKWKDNSDIEKSDPVAVPDPSVAKIKEEPPLGAQEPSVTTLNIKKESTLPLEAWVTKNESTVSSEARLLEGMKTEAEDWPEGETAWTQDHDA